MGAAVLERANRSGCEGVSVLDESLVTAVTCRTARVARLRPPQQARSPRHVPRPAGRRGRAAARLEVRRCGQQVPLAVPGRSWRSPPTEAQDLRRAAAARGTRARD